MLFSNNNIIISIYRRRTDSLIGKNLPDTPVHYRASVNNTDSHNQYISPGTSIM